MVGASRSRVVAVLGHAHVHKIHHSRQVEETNSNYANLLTIYDRLLGTYTPAERAESVIYGLEQDGNLGAASFTGLVTIPFSVKTLASLTEKSESKSAPAINMRSSASAHRRRRTQTG